MRNKKTAQLIALCLCCAVLFLAIACKKQETPPTAVPQNTEETVSHTWYYFTGGEYIKIDLPQNAPDTLFKPWTEAARISASSVSGKYAYFLVNRTGLLQFGGNHGTDDSLRLFTDQAIFGGTTAENLFSMEDEPVFNVYRSSFFNAANTAKSPFLVQFRPEGGFFIPVLSAEDIGIDAKSQPVSVVYDGKNWATAFKSIEGEKVVFKYMRFSSYEPLLPLLPANRKSVLQREQISAEVFKELNILKKFSESPKALQQLLIQLPKSLSFQVECIVPDAGTPQVWVNEGTSGNAEDLQAQALITDSCSIAIFRDGTSYFAGALSGKYTVKNGKTSVFRLPKLPAGFAYTHIALAGSQLYVSWEESLFYETGRSGFLSVNLEKVLYK